MEERADGGLISPVTVVAARGRTADLSPTPALRVAENLWLKLENLQPTGSFKVRGFLNAVAQLEDTQRESGIVTVSAGNAALAAAWVARRLGIRCRVVMFETAPPPKRLGVEALGAEVLAWPRDEVLAWMARKGWEDMPEFFIHPFADEAVMAGHAGLGMELVEQVPGIARVVVPVGGGGLVVGVTSGLRAAGSEAEVVGAQSDGYPLWVRTMAEGAPPALTPATIADGTAAPYDASMRARLEAAVQSWLAVPEEGVRTAVGELARVHKLVVEGGGAIAFAAARILMDGPPAVPTVAVISGGNIDPALQAQLIAGPADPG